MPDALPERFARAPVTERPSPVAPLLVWMLVQFVPLTLAAARVPLSARFPVPAEKLALHEMLIGQLVALALLFPFLLRDRSSAIVVTTTSLPFLWLAGHLADAPQSTLYLAGGYLIGLMIVLSVLVTLLRTTLARQVAVCITSVVTLLPPLLLYLHAEFRTIGTSQSEAYWPKFFPLPAAMRVLDGSASPAAFFVLLAAFVLSLFARLVYMKRRV